MADYWISRDKYFCKYCNIYIADDKPSRLHHETGLRHKGNYERYIRDIYKKGMQQKKDRAEEAKELARVEAAAAAAMGLPPPESTAPVASSSKPKPAAPPKPADPYANYTTAAFLGIRDEAAERAAAEAERRQNEGVIGEWQKVVKPRAPAPPLVDSGSDKGKRRAEEELGGFRGEAVLRPGSGANGIKREDGDSAADRKPDFVALNDAEDTKPSMTAARSLGERADDDDSTVETAKKRGFLSEKSALNDDDDNDPLLSLGPIKLKKRRLTVKEQQAEEEKRLAKEREVEEVLRSRAARNGQKGAWESVDPTGDEDAAFDPFAGTGSEGNQAEEGGAAEDGGDRPVQQAAPAPEEVKPQATALFKKKKRPGGGGLKSK